MCIIIVLAAALCVGVVGFASGDDKKTAYVFIGTDKQNHIDTVMAAEFDKKGIAVTSIPRDTVDIDAYTLECSESSVEMILSAIPKLLGFTADKYIIADTDSIMTLLSMLGNVNFEIPDLFGDGVGMVYDDSYQDLHISLPSGEHELSGKEMLDVMRYRRGNTNDSGVYNAYAEGDIDRIKMTHKLLNAIVSQKKDIILSDEMFNSVHNAMLSFNTNIELTDLRKLFKALKNGGITFNLLDGKYEKDINGVLLYIPQTHMPDSEAL